MDKYWIFLIVAGLTETCFAVSLKLSENFSKLMPSLAFLFFAACSFTLLSQAMRAIPLSTAYAVWCGLGIAGTSIVGFMAFNEPFSMLKVGFVVLIMLGIVGLKLSS